MLINQPVQRVWLLPSLIIDYLGLEGECLIEKQMVHLKTACPIPYFLESRDWANAFRVRNQGVEGIGLEGRVAPASLNQRDIRPFMCCLSHMAPRNHFPIPLLGFLPPAA